MRNAVMKKQVYKMAGICINHFQNEHQNKNYWVWANIQSTQYEQRTARTDIGAGI
jgi:hypothetical protein